MGVRYALQGERWDGDVRLIRWGIGQLKRWIEQSPPQRGVGFENSELRGPERIRKLELLELATSLELAFL